MHYFRGRTFHENRIASAKALRQEHALWVEGTARRPVWLVWSEKEWQGLRAE